MHICCLFQKKLSLQSARRFWTRRILVLCIVVVQLTVASYCFVCCLVALIKMIQRVNARITSVHRPSQSFPVRFRCEFTPHAVQCTHYQPSRLTAIVGTRQFSAYTRILHTFRHLISVLLFASIFNEILTLSFTSHRTSRSSWFICDWYSFAY